MLRKNLARTEQLLSDAQSENKSLQNANSKLMMNLSEMTQDKSKADLQIRKMRLDLAHERSRTNSVLDPFDNLKYGSSEDTGRHQVSISNPSSRRESSGTESNVSDIPFQINQILGRLDKEDDDVDERFNIPSPPPSSQNHSEADYVFRQPLPKSMKRNAQEEEYNVRSNEQFEEDCAGPSTSSNKRKLGDRRSSVNSWVC